MDIGHVIHLGIRYHSPPCDRSPLKAPIEGLLVENSTVGSTSGVQRRPA